MDGPGHDDILSILSAEARIDPARLKPDARFDDVGVAWYDVVKTVYTLEMRYGIDLPVNEHQIGAELITVGQFVGVIVGSFAMQSRSLNGSAGLQG